MASEKMIEILPGTEVMKDHDGIHYIHAHNAAQGPVLLPTPSENAHDPLVCHLIYFSARILKENYRTGVESGKRPLFSTKAYLCLSAS